MIMGQKTKEVKGRFEVHDQNQFTARISGEKIESLQNSFCRYYSLSSVIVEFKSEDGEVIQKQF